MMSIGRVSAGNGYEYLTQEVVSDAHDYYTGAGEAPGRWTGSGIDRLGLSGQVSEQQMAALFGSGCHPETLEHLSTPYRTYKSVTERIEAAIEAAGPDITDEQIAQIRAEQYRIGDRTAVAGFDCTFSPAKSVSALWAIAPDVQRAEIEAAHEAAMDQAFAHLEDRALHTRAGTNGVRHLDAEGFVVARYRHRTSRNGDPQLHTHCAMLNRVWSTSEGKWRTLNAKSLYRERAGADTVYMAAVERELHARLGVTFKTRGERREISTVPQELIERWSSRRQQILAHYDDSAVDGGRQLTPQERSDRLRTVTLQTRRDKVRDGHVGLHERWNSEADAGGVDWSSLAPAGAPRRGATVEVLDDATAAKVIAAALDSLEESRAEWSYSYLVAAIGEHAPGAYDRQTLDDLARRALRDVRVVSLSVGDIGDRVPLARRNGVSVYRDPNREKFSTRAVMDAEAFLVSTADLTNVATTDRAAVKAELAATELGVDQSAAAEHILSDPHAISIVIGPAGTGKTRTQRAVVDIARRHGRAVIGLATSQNAAEVLAAEAGCRCENIAKFAWHYGEVGWTFETGQIVIVDEAAMAGTLDLEFIVQRAQEVGAKVAFVGDDRQLQSPSAGGAMRMLARNSETTWLAEVRRFSAAWERDASMAVRDGDAGIAATYDLHGRVHGGSRSDMLAALVDDWAADRDAGVETLMMAGDNDTVADLAARARARLVAAGNVEAAGVELHDGNRAGVGDVVVTRNNDGRLRSEFDRQVTNRAVWNVTQRYPNGALTVVGQTGGDRTFLPPSYVAEHVELGYAATGHGAQGRTIDRGRCLIDDVSAGALVYVMMTRGRHGNDAYVALDATSDTDDRIVSHDAAALFGAAIARNDRMTGALDTFAAEVDLADGAVQLDEIHGDWQTVIARHLNPNSELVPGTLVRAHDRNNIGTVVSSADDVTVVHFVSPDLHEATIELPTADVMSLSPKIPEWLDDTAEVSAHRRHSDDPYLSVLVSYLDDINRARTSLASRLGEDASGKLWTTRVDPQLVDDVAYFRERWSITSDAPLGLESSTGPGGNDRQQDVLQHRLDEQPVDTLSTLAAKRDGSVASDASPDDIATAMEDRRELIVSIIETADTPPEWAEDLLESSMWSKNSNRRRRERDLVSQVALYRDRFDVLDDNGVGSRPADAGTQADLFGRIASAVRKLRLSTDDGLTSEQVATAQRETTTFER